jgi:hypothetical protein
MTKAIALAVAWVATLLMLGKSAAAWTTVCPRDPTAFYDCALSAGEKQQDMEVLSAGSIALAQCSGDRRCAGRLMQEHYGPGRGLDPISQY